VTGPLRLVVMGTGPFAVPMFHGLVASPHDVVAVVTRPDRASPGRRPPPNPMRAAATAAGIGILDPDDVNAPATVAMLAAPRHRGAAPVQWAILAGDAASGVSVIHMTAALDAGNVIVARATPIGSRETAAELEPRLAALGVEAVLEAIDRLQAAVAATGSAVGVGVPQEVAQATRAPRLAKADGIVNWTWPAARIERLRRAVEPWPRAGHAARLTGVSGCREARSASFDGAVSRSTEHRRCRHAAANRVLTTR